jgi:hypothetical protein
MPKPIVIGSAARAEPGVLIAARITAIAPAQRHSLFTPIMFPPSSRGILVLIVTRARRHESSTQTSGPAAAALPINQDWEIAGVCGSRA